MLQSIFETCKNSSTKKLSCSNLKLQSHDEIFLRKKICAARFWVKKKDTIVVLRNSLKVFLNYFHVTENFEFFSGTAWRETKQEMDWIHKYKYWRYFKEKWNWV